ncbi:hypothetical protein ACFE04_010301 [Oxalis oulophora]
METIQYFEIFLILVSCFLFLKNYPKISPTTNWPVVGMLPGLLYAGRSIHDYATQVLKENGGTFEFRGPWFTNLDFFVTSDPLNIRHVLTTNFANYPKGPDFKKLFEPFGNGFLNSDAESWKFHRNLVQTHVRENKFQVFLEQCLTEKISKGLIPVLDHVKNLKADVDLQDVFQRFTYDISCLLVLGIDSESLSVGLPHVPCEQAFDDIEGAVFNRHVTPEIIWKFQKWLHLGKEGKLIKARKIIDEFLYNCISLKKKQIPNEGKFNYDIITSAIEGNSDEYLRDMAFNFIAAGRDTVRTGLTWLLWIVTKIPNVKQKILKEIKQNIPEAKDQNEANLRIFTVQELNKLVYLHATICESLRLYPPVPFNHRVSLKPDRLPSGHLVNENTRVFISPYAMGQSEEIWGEDCLMFKPERWINKEGGIKHVPSYEFSVFHSGPRSCLERNMTFAQMKMVLSAIIWNFDVEVVKGHRVEPTLSVMLQMAHGLKVKVNKKKH